VFQDGSVEAVVAGPFFLRPHYCFVRRFDIAAGLSPN
jgi:hypothetical protein